KHLRGRGRELFEGDMRPRALTGGPIGGRVVLVYSTHPRGEAGGVRRGVGGAGPRGAGGRGRRAHKRAPNVRWPDVPAGWAHVRGDRRRRADGETGRGGNRGGAAARARPADGLHRSTGQGRGLRTA